MTPTEELEWIEKRLDELWASTMGPLYRLSQGSKNTDPESDLDEFLNGHEAENDEYDRLVNRRAYLKEHTR